jgi:hypothetical protein
MNRNKIYEKKARLYPVIISMLLPLFIMIIISNQILSTVLEIKKIWNIAISIIPATLITGALIYAVKSLVRSTSKALFQFPLFKENESKMPTTELLLWKNNTISKQNKTLIAEKISQEIGLNLMNENEENQDENEARLLIADAVKNIREKTRDNIILFNYNCNYGFVRNLMGANIWALTILVSVLIVNYFCTVINYKLLLIAIAIILISFPICFFVLKQNAKEYARQLYTAYLEI